MVAREILLVYPRFDQPFIIYTDSSQYQLGSVITQSGKPLAFYSRKLNSAQRKYTTREQELLAVVETLKEFKTILFGMDIIIHTDHQNLTYKTPCLSSDRVMRWRLLLEEYCPRWVYMKGVKNVIADMMSRYPIMSSESGREE